LTTALPRLLKLDSGNTSHHVNSDGRLPDLIEGVLCRKILRSYVLQRCSESSKRAKYSCSIIFRGLYPKIEILCKTRLGIEHQRITTNNEIPNVFLVEYAQ
jgi:hypothetical protein